MYQLDCYAISHIGRRRRKQEDHFYLCETVNRDMTQTGDISPLENPVITMHYTYALDRERFIAVSDGMGGHSGGEIASRTVVENLSAIEKAVRYRSSREEPTEIINQMIVLINDLILKLSERESELHDMGATLAGVFFLEGQALTVNIGDSRVYLMRSGKLTRLTEDHTEKQMLSRIGVNPETSAGKGRLMKYLGYKKENGRLMADIIPVSGLYPGDRFLVCTDGLTDEVTDQRIEGIMCKHSNSEEALNELIQAALVGQEGNGGRDNITAIIVEVINIMDEILC